MSESVFPITEADRRQVVDVLLQIIGNGTPEQQTEASAVLVNMVAMNQSCERHREPWMDSGSDDH